MDYYNISLHGFFFYEFCSSFSSKKVFIGFASLFFSLKHCGLLQCFPTWFLFSKSISPHVFFQNYLCRFFFNIELVENLVLTFPTCFFFFVLIFFFQNCLLIFLFFFFVFFFQNCFCWFYFFNMELVENLAL